MLERRKKSCHALNVEFWLSCGIGLVCTNFRIFIFCRPKNQNIPRLKSSKYVCSWMCVCVCLCHNSTNWTLWNKRISLTWLQLNEKRVCFFLVLAFVPLFRLAFFTCVYNTSIHTFFWLYMALFERHNMNSIALQSRVYFCVLLFLFWMESAGLGFSYVFVIYTQWKTDRERERKSGKKNDLMSLYAC